MKPHTHRPGAHPGCASCDWMALHAEFKFNDARELSNAKVREQAQALDEYIRRGGMTSQWFSSKQFLPGDRAAILLALSDLDQETA